MRAEIVPMEMAVDIDQAWADSESDKSNQRNLPGWIGTPSRFQGEESRVTVGQIGGLSLCYGLDRRIPHETDSAHDMVTWAIGNVKLVFTTEEWAMLVAKTDVLIEKGRMSWEAAFGQEKTA